MAWVVDKMLRRGVEVDRIRVECDAAALNNRETFLEGLIDVYQKRSAVFRKLPRGTGRACFTDRGEAGWWFPLEETEDLDRIISRLTGRWRKKFMGLATPTLLVVRAEMLFGSTPQRVLEKAREVAASLQPVLGTLGTIGAILVYDEIFWSPPSPAFGAFPDFRLALGAVEGCPRAAMLVPNQHAANPLTAAELDVLVGPNMLW